MNKFRKGMKLSAIRLGLCVSCVTVIGAIPSAAFATDGYFLSGIGASAEGSAGVAIAMPQDSLAIASNPASATDLGSRLDVGAELFAPDRSATIVGNGAGLNGSFSGNDARVFVLPNFGLVKQVSSKLSLGIAVYGNGGMNTDYEKNPFAPFGATGAAGIDLKQMFISPTAAYQIVPGQSIGVSPIAMLQSFKAYGIQPFKGYSSNPLMFTNNGESWGVGGGFRVGYLGHFTQYVKIGAFYQSKIRAQSFDRYTGLFANSGNFDVPSSYGAGIALTPIPAVTLGFDYKRIEYTSVQTVGNPINSLFTGVPFGSTNGPGFGWQDINTWKAALVVKVSPTWTLRTGFEHSGNPVPDTQTLFGMLAPGVVQNAVTFGATWKSGKRWDLTGYVFRALKNTVNGNGSIPMSFGGGEANISLAETAVGLSYGLKL